jgi:ABC-type branched-subunit amino acid transport system substrate-binding protein
MNQLIQSDKVHVLVGPGASDIGAAAVPPWKQVADRPVWLVPGVSTTVAENAVGKDPYYFHTFPWTYDYHSTNVDALKLAIGSNHRVAIVYSDGAYGRAHIEAARKYLKQGGFNIVAEELIREGGNDFTPSLLKLRAQKPDMIYTLLQTADAVQVTKQIKSVNLGVPYLIGTFQAALPEWKNAVGDLQQCWTGVTTYLPGANFPADKREPKLFPSGNTWEAAWRARYKKEPEYMEAGAYISTILALLAIEKTNSLDRDKIAAALSEADYASVLGPTKFEPSEIGLHQAFSRMLVFQQQKTANGYEPVLLYPTANAKGKLQSCPT